MMAVRMCVAIRMTVRLHVGNRRRDCLECARVESASFERSDSESSAYVSFVDIGDRPVGREPKMLSGILCN
jgi:hypothetical protein